MKELSASEAARRFSAVLDGAEDGESYVITRGGRRVAMIVPAPRANGRAVADVLGRWHHRLAVDDGFAADVESAGAATTDRDGDPWLD
ncbi:MULTISPECIES: type II toxin-antitoxin system prevent-host-death family antitoxin [unclassified Pseudonocardia]|jgi:prevent-host-death family protein|uniref:type II toxin-antitoxin system Phd/YefM family antitoxin n=1 Tax=unclassified Pseudonocardia TaxID=2619320 RepID=UPI00095F4023|nr:MULTISPECIES: type II toxin-antitoxin system prevent-host-death family antitoxin [unclassified Pseudonocardia]MBN9101093.1 type II toxin-antitoxin system prevent-host-death family antitoxin [Pseudonocardia sp.]OJY41414.1 MAG: prevent-host-death family protein [Pseudonocardia sp. 73-21]